MYIDYNNNAQHFKHKDLYLVMQIHCIYQNINEDNKQKNTA